MHRLDLEQYARGCALALALFASGCSDHRNIASNGVRQTHFPGQLAAGGKSSGELMQQKGEGIKSSMPSGTPGIPQGAGGTTSGPAMGGTTPGSATAGNAPKGQMAGETAVGGDAARAGAVGTAPTKSPADAAGATTAAAPAAPAAATSPAPPGSAATPVAAGTPAAPAATGAAQQPSAAQQAAAKAQQEKQELAASMDEVTRRWRAEAAKSGRQTHPATPIEAVAGIATSNAQDHTRTSMPPPVRSEKDGSAGPSEDVKKPKEPGAK
jgi:hypothetical protein